MNRSNPVLQSDDDAQERRELRERKPVREWTAEQRREVFLEACRIERERAEAGIVEKWDLCQDCHDYKCERGFSWCKKCIEQMHQYEE